MESRRFETEFTENCRKSLEQKDLLAQLRDTKYDLLTTELFDGCASGILKVIYLMTLLHFLLTN